jgi:fructokinase
LGLKTVLIATCGDDGLGAFILDSLESNQVDVSHVRKSTTEPTSVIFVSKSTGTPDFIAYREADIQILPSQISDELLAKAKIFHTTCFALSKNPARTTIVESAVKAKSLGLQTSIDINFSERIWPDREEAKQVLKAYLATDPLVKLSEDDCFRLFAEEQSEAFIFEFFHGLGATTICLTKGKDGVVLSDKIHGIFRQNATQLDNIKDTTGAGDAFWTGFLYARLLQKDFEESITIAQKLAVLKLQSVGKLPDGIDIPAYLHSNN